MTILHDYWRSSASWRVRIALSIKGVKWQSRSHDLTRNEQRDSEYLSLNPQGFVPSWQEPDGWTVAQSVAILEYLEERFPTPALLPASARARAEVRSLVQTIACDIHPLNNLRVTRYLREQWQADDAFQVHAFDAARLAAAGIQRRVFERSHEGSVFHTDADDLSHRGNPCQDLRPTVIPEPGHRETRVLHHDLL